MLNQHFQWILELVKLLADVPFTLVMTGAFSQTVSKLFSGLEEVTDTLPLHLILLLLIW